VSQGKNTVWFTRLGLLVDDSTDVTITKKLVVYAQIAVLSWIYQMKGQKQL
jgi:hypothetical protein